MSHPLYPTTWFVHCYHDIICSVVLLVHAENIVNLINWKWPGGEAMYVVPG